MTILLQSVTIQFHRLFRHISYYKVNTKSRKGWKKVRTDTIWKYCRSSGK